MSVWNEYTVNKYSTKSKSLKNIIKIQNAECLDIQRKVQQLD